MVDGEAVSRWPSPLLTAEYISRLAQAEGDIHSAMVVADVNLAGTAPNQPFDQRVDSWKQNGFEIVYTKRAAVPGIGTNINTISVTREHLIAHLPHKLDLIQRDPDAVLLLVIGDVRYTELVPELARRQMPFIVFATNAILDREDVRASAECIRCLYDNGDTDLRVYMSIIDPVKPIPAVFRPTEEEQREFDRMIASEMDCKRCGHRIKIGQYIQHECCPLYREPSNVHIVNASDIVIAINVLDDMDVVDFFQWYHDILESNTSDDVIDLVLQRSSVTQEVIDAICILRFLIREEGCLVSDLIRNMGAIPSDLERLEQLHLISEDDGAYQLSTQSPLDKEALQRLIRNLDDDLP